jgi:FtsP/CotA-like multicopper oxidase with cupredoxin domain
VRSSAAVLVLVSMGVALAACGADPAGPTPPVSPGSSGAPRDVNLIAKDYAFAPDVLDLVPGETVTLHVINGGLEIHEAIIGDIAVQDAWEVAELAVAGAPPGPTPVVSVPPEVAGLRIVVRSGERIDVVWTVPADASAGGPWIVGCHIPGHWEKGMQIPVRWTGQAAAETPAPNAASVVRSDRAGRGASTASSVGGSR